MRSEWLRPLSPLGKFSVIKAVVFVSWWQASARGAHVGAARAAACSRSHMHAQHATRTRTRQGVAITGLVSVGVIKPTLTYSEHEVAMGLQVRATERGVRREESDGVRASCKDNCALYLVTATSIMTPPRVLAAHARAHTRTF